MGQTDPRRISQLYQGVCASTTTRNYPTRSRILAFLINVTARKDATSPDVRLTTVIYIHGHIDRSSGVRDFPESTREGPPTRYVDRVSDEQGDDAGGWRVVVEETVGMGRNSHRWEITQVQPQPSRDEARRAAGILAESYRPEHPHSPRNRCVYQAGDDTWLVRLSGMTSDYHFRIYAARLIGGSDAHLTG